MFTAPDAWSTVEGKTQRYRCSTISSVDVHLRQMVTRMYGCAAELGPQTLTLMFGLLFDRDRLLERRLELERKGTRG